MDKSTSPAKKTVLIGLSGGRDSLVAAYLLKRQGHNVIGIGVLFAPEEDQDTEKPSFCGAYLIEDIEAVKSLCNKIKIPFYAVSAQEIYKARVSEFLVSARLGGQHFFPELAATNVIFEVLHSKMSLLAADKIATGHYARISYNSQTNAHQIYTSQDPQSDQSGLLALLPSHLLGALELPLSGMRHQEVPQN